MRVLLLILMLVTPEPPQIFSATGVYVPQVQKENVSRDPVADEYYAVMFTASWCPPCRDYKTPGGKFDRLKLLLPGTVAIDTDVNPEWKKSRQVRDPSGNMTTQTGVNRLPEFWLVRKRDKWPVKRWQPGAVSPEEIYSLATLLTEQEHMNVQ
jgi:thiol-disulfide isomerase/thioredoxin